MNLLHIKYAVEVSKTQSISKAAENLFMGQPNLSRAIKELEESLGITIFERNSRGIRVTKEGEEFLQYARLILNQVDAVESLYKEGKRHTQKFSACVPRVSYIAAAFSDLAADIDRTVPVAFFYEETNSMRTVSSVCNGDCDLGIVHYQDTIEPYFTQLFAEKNLISEPIGNYPLVLLMSKKSPLVSKMNIGNTELHDAVEIVQGEEHISSLSSSNVKYVGQSGSLDKHIYVSERSSQFMLLDTMPNAFMWDAPVPQQLLQEYHLVQRRSKQAKEYRDVLIYRKDYRLSTWDNLFIEKVRKRCAQLF